MADLPTTLRCGVCERECDESANPLKIQGVANIAWRPGCPTMWCFDCFVVWYDEGVVDPQEIRNRVRDRIKHVEGRMYIES